MAVVQFLRFAPTRQPHRFTSVRLTLGRFLALGLEFQLASDVLTTAIAPSFEELGKLAAVAAIRTALNFFLAREIKEEENQVGGRGGRGRPGAALHEDCPTDGVGDVSTLAGNTAGSTRDEGRDGSRPGSSGGTGGDRG